MADDVTVFIRRGDPQCEALLRYLDQRNLTYTTRDVTSDPSATAILFGRLGRVAVPALLIGERLIVGFDPVQLSRYLPRSQEDGPGVSFGAAVRGVTVDIAREHGLPAAFGVEVGNVREGSPAAAAGVIPGDVITAIGAYTLTGGADQFRTAVGARQPGDAMTLTVWRDGPVELVVEFPRETVPPTGES
ncbi:MAG TPA: PDZ domain-containing protein [Candidatus Dormibacteraeota bacterium]|jgi:glutaredoxin